MIGWFDFDLADLNIRHEKWHLASCLVQCRVLHKQVRQMHSDRVRSIAVHCVRSLHCTLFMHRMHCFSRFSIWAKRNFWLSVSPGSCSAEALIRWGGKIKYHLIAYFPGRVDSDQSKEGARLTHVRARFESPSPPHGDVSLNDWQREGTVYAATSSDSRQLIWWIRRIFSAFSVLITGRAFCHSKSVMEIPTIFVFFWGGEILALALPGVTGYQ